MGPTFILGFPRSGTTALASALSEIDGMGRYSLEGHALYLFSDALDRIRRNDTNGNCVFRDESKKAAFLKHFARAINAAFDDKSDPDSTRWIDKTPDIHQIAAVPMLVQLYPDARFVYLYRAPLSAVRSNIATWPSLLTGKELEIAQRWVNCARAWRTSRTAIPEGNWIDLHQADMLKDASGTSAALAALFLLSEKDRAAIEAFLSANKRVNRPVEPSASKRYDETRVDDDLSARIAHICRDELQFWPKLQS